MHPVVSLCLNARYFSYIDPNAGGWLFQLIFPVFVAIGGAFLVMRRKAGELFRRLFGSKKDKPDDHK